MMLNWRTYLTDPRVPIVGFVLSFVVFRTVVVGDLALDICKRNVEDMSKHATRTVSNVCGKWQMLADQRDRQSLLAFASFVTFWTIVSGQPFYLVRRLVSTSDWLPSCTVVALAMAAFPERLTS